LLVVPRKPLRLRPFNNFRGLTTAYWELVSLLYSDRKLGQALSGIACGLLLTIGPPQKNCAQASEQLVATVWFNEIKWFAQSGSGGLGAKPGRPRGGNGG
jgi:hypothetical protein